MQLQSGEAYNMFTISGWLAAIFRPLIRPQGLVRLAIAIGTLKSGLGLKLRAAISIG